MTPEHYEKCKAELHLEYSSMLLVEHYSFIAGNFLKYMLRYKHKKDPVGDLLKAKDYMDLLKKKSDWSVTRVYLKPIFISDNHDFQNMIQAFKQSYDWFNLCVDSSGNLFNSSGNFVAMEKFINSELEQYTQLHS